MNPGRFCSLARVLERGMLASGKGATAGHRRRVNSPIGEVPVCQSEKDATAGRRRRSLPGGTA